MLLRMFFIIKNNKSNVIKIILINKTCHFSKICIITNLYMVKFYFILPFSLFAVELVKDIMTKRWRQILSVFLTILKIIYPFTVIIYERTEHIFSVFMGKIFSRECDSLGLVKILEAVW